MRLGIIPRLKVKPGNEEKLEQVLAEIVETTRKNEPSSPYYGAFKSTSDGTYILIEVFEDEAAFDVHRTSSYIQAGVRRINELLAEPYAVEFFEEIKR